MLINCQNVSFIREKECILQEINWQMSPGENWVILGLNGSGKTTLLKMITGYNWPSNGELTVLGETFGKTSIPDLKKKIGWVSSDLKHRINSNDVSENIVLSGKFASIGIWEKTTKDEEDLAKHILIRCGGKALIGKKFGILSQGQQQIVLIARALMAKPELLIFDEPCNGLDLFARQSMLDRIDHIAQEKQTKGLIFVTHYIEEIPASFDHILLLKDGKIFAKGLKSDVLTPDLLTRFYDNAVEVIKLPDNRLTIIPKSSK
ncbi:molybdenum ABC transporter ATP-binding protein [Vagococcus martis]|uniref:Molybdenum ABC transporter ATP-binding protein n=1 Tax=Vagococcus martis TaxID=1768210 RepID=A0A1V4DJP9_9ENTE|nr:ABC transporter ATP-binding protein [Vagococcus martis]OPF88817.1 molybdenum ABC transporter ATP-binding protein [Vagococcus martis]